MSERTVRECDHCGKETSLPRLQPVVGTQTGVNGVEAKHEDLDLCPACCQILIDKIFAAISASEKKTYVGLMKRRY
jgi:hypothetical protein